MDRCRHGLTTASCATCSAGSRGLRRTASRQHSGLNEQVSPFGPPSAAGPCQFLTAVGKPCQNLGRYWVDGRWSCSRNHPR